MSHCHVMKGGRVLRCGCPWLGHAVLGSLLQLHTLQIGLLCGVGRRFPGLREEAMDWVVIATIVSPGILAGWAQRGLSRVAKEVGVESAEKTKKAKSALEIYKTIPSKHGLFGPCSPVWSTSVLVVAPSMKTMVPRQGAPQP